MLYRKSVVFGKLVQGHEVLKKIEDAGDEEGRPAVTVKIINCGEFSEGKINCGAHPPQELNSDIPRKIILVVFCMVWLFL